MQQIVIGSIALITTISSLAIARSIQSSDDDDSIDLIQFGSKLFGKPVEIADARLSGDNPEEVSSYLQGDLLMPITDDDGLHSDKTRNGMRAESSRWRGGEVPFEIRGSFSEFYERI